MATPSRASRTSSRCTSALVAMSMPRVGSSTISSVGLAAQPLGQHDLLLVAAGQPGHRVDQAPVLEVEPDRPVGRERPLGRGPDQARLAQPAERRERHVLLHRHVHDQALLPPVLGDEADPRGHRAGRRGPPQLAAAHHDPARVVAVDAEHGPGHLAAARPDQPGQGDDLARPDVQRDVGEHAFPGQVLHVEHDARRARRARRPPASSICRPTMARTRSSAVSPASSLVSTCRPSRMTVTRWQISKTSSRRCEMNRTAAPAERSVRDHVEQPGDLGGGQGRGGLVHHDDPGVQGQGLGDLDDLLVGDGQPAADAARVELDPQPGEQGRGRPRASGAGRSAARRAAAGAP